MLTPTQRRKNITSLKTEHSRLLAKEKAETFAKRPPCPFCGHNHIYAYGSNPGNNKRFKCAACKKTFTQKTGTCLHYIHHRSKFQKYMELLLSEGHKPLRQLSKEFEICVLTAFDWRHKILSAINVTNKQLDGLIELRNSSFSFSRKGIHLSKNASKAANHQKASVRLIIAADYDNNSSIEIAKIGKLKLSDIEKRLKDKFAHNPVIISPKDKLIEAFGKKQKLSITQFSKNDNPNELKLKRSSAIDIGLKQLVYAKARGVSTKYLHLYARWLLTTTKSPSVSIIPEVKRSTSAWAGYTGCESKYELFCKEYSELPHIRTAHRDWKTVGDYCSNEPKR